MRPGASEPADHGQSGPESRAGWPEFERRLARALAAMVPESYLILSTPSGRDEAASFVQFANATTVFRAEAASNRALAGGRLLSAEQEAALDGLGWQRPRSGEATGPNFSRDWDMPPPVDEIADLAVQTLRRVYAIAAPGDLQYVYSSFAGTPVEDPELGIPARPRTPVPERKPRSRRGLAKLALVVEEGLRRWTAVDNVVRDADGDWPVRVGSTILFVRLVDGRPPAVAIFSPVLRDVATTPALLAAVNELNGQIRFGRVFVVEHQVVVATELTAVGLTADQIAIAGIELGNLADTLDDTLHGRFGGKQVFASRPPLVN